MPARCLRRPDGSSAADEGGEAPSAGGTPWSPPPPPPPPPHHHWWWSHTYKLTLPHTPFPQVTLDAFNGVEICGPINVLVVPSTGGAYTLTLEAEPAALGALSYSVKDGTLSLGLSTSFDTTEPIQVTAALPASDLASLQTTSTGGRRAAGAGQRAGARSTCRAAGGGALPRPACSSCCAPFADRWMTTKPLPRCAGDIIVAPGFQPASLGIDVSGSGNVVVNNATAGSVSVNVAG